MSAAAWITVLPLAVITSLPSIIIFTGSMKNWSVGEMEYGGDGPQPRQYSNTPLLRYSILPIVHLLSATCASNSSRYLRMNAPGGQAAASPNGQIVLPAM